MAKLTGYLQGTLLPSKAFPLIKTNLLPPNRGYISTEVASMPYFSFSLYPGYPPGSNIVI